MKFNFMFLGLFAFALCSPFSFGKATPSASSQVWTPNTNPPAFDKVIWIWLENTSYNDMIDQDYVQSLIKNYPSAVLTHESPVSAITQANAFALISGSDQKINDDLLHTYDVQSLVQLLESKNKTWKVYAESFLGSCYLGEGGDDYRRSRVPFLSLTSIQSNRFLCSKVVTFKMLKDNLKHGTFPALSIIIPGLNGSGATSDAGTADDELKNILTPILASNEGLSRATVIISTLNDQHSPAPGLFTLFFGNAVQNGHVTLNDAHDHYDLLRTLEIGLNLGHLHQNDAKASPILGFWK